MLPLRDDNPTSRPPVVTWVLIGLCLLTFLWQRSDRSRDGESTMAFAMVPARVLGDDTSLERLVGFDRFTGRRVTERVAPAAIPEWLTLLTCIFLHGGWLHLLGNLWVLWIFGDNVEDRFGRPGFAVFYLLCGVAASLAHLLANPDSTVPTVGASGAIAGVMGAYLLLYPRARVMALIPLGFILQIMVVPAFVFLGFWLLLQVFSVLMEIGRGGVSGVAWWAHIGGFLVGIAVAWLLRKRGWLRRPAVRVTLRGGRMGMRRGRRLY